jgi:YVTN family beta-propeller protein
MSSGTHGDSRRPSAEVVRRRRVVAVSALVSVVMVLAASLAASKPGSPRASTGAREASQRPQGSLRTASSAPAPGRKRIPPGPPSDQRRLSLIKSIGGQISPKSVDASGTGLVFAQNMMYRHTVTVYNSAGSLVRTIPDTVDMSRFGIQGHPGITHGAPVEAAFTPDARHVYVSNYSMYGSGFGPEGNDTCTPESARAAGDTNSYVYRINVAALSIDQVIEVGMVPKFLTVTPDGRYVLVANWCSFDLSVVSIAQGKEVARLPIGAYPRGLAVSPDSRTAYVAVMGGDTVVKVNLDTLKEEGSITVGDNPRHLVIDPAGHYLYASLNGPGDVVKVDLATDAVVDRTHTGDAARSLAISGDGRSLYVVNYSSNSVTKLRASDLGPLQTVGTGVHPIGISYDPATGNVWVAVYSGQILVFADR